MLSRMHSCITDWLTNVVPPEDRFTIRWKVVKELLLKEGFDKAVLSSKHLWYGPASLYQFTSNVANDLHDAEKAVAVEDKRRAVTPTDTQTMAVDGEDKRRAVTPTGTQTMVVQASVPEELALAAQHMPRAEEPAEEVLDAEEMLDVEDVPPAEDVLDAEEPAEEVLDAEDVPPAEEPAEDVPPAVDMPPAEEPAVDVPPAVDMPPAEEPAEEVPPAEEPAEEMLDAEGPPVVAAAVEAAVHEADDGSATETDEDDVLVIPSHVTLDFKREIIPMSKYVSFGRSVLTSQVGREAWMGAHDIIELQVQLKDLESRLDIEKASWCSRYDSLAIKYSEDVTAAEKAEAEADGFVNVHSSMVSNFEQLIAMCKDPSKVAEYKTYLASSESELRSSKILFETRRSSLDQARSSLAQTIKDINSVHRFVDETFDISGKWRATTVPAKKRAAKNRSSNSSRWPDTPSGVRPTEAVLIKPEAIKLMKEIFDKLEKEHGDVFGTARATTTPCDCSRCKKTSSQHPPSPLVKHIWAAFSLDGTLDVANTGVWSATTRREGEPLGPRCLGSGEAPPSGGKKYDSLINNVTDRVFGSTRGHEAFFFVHIHDDPLSPDNKYIMLVPKPCESDPKFFADNGFPGYSSEGGVMFGRCHRTTNPKVTCMKLYGALGWNDNSSWNERTGAWTSIYYRGKKRHFDADDDVPQKKKAKKTKL